MCDHHDHNDDHDERRLDRWSFLRTGLAAGAAGAATVTGLVAGAARADEDPYAPPAEPALADGGMTLNVERATLVVTDPQIDFLSPDGVTRGVVGASVEQHRTSKTSTACSWRRRQRA